MTISTEEEIFKERKNQKFDKKTSVYISGTWDLFHIGHLNAIKKAKALGNYLIVGVSTDELVQEYKKNPPIFPFDHRWKIVESLKFVDRVIVQKELSTYKQFKELDFDILVVGDDWKNKHLEGIDWIKNHPVKKVVFLPRTQGISSSELKSKVQGLQGNL